MDVAVENANPITGRNFLINLNGFSLVKTNMNLVVNVLLSAVLNGEPLFRWQYLAALVFVCMG